MCVASSIAILAQTIDFMIVEIIGGCSYLVVGALLVFRRPGNVLGPMFVAIGTGWMVVFLGITTADTFDEAGRIDPRELDALLAVLLTLPLIWLFPAVSNSRPGWAHPLGSARRLLRGPERSRWS